MLAEPVSATLASRQGPHDVNAPHGSIPGRRTRHGGGHENGDAMVKKKRQPRSEAVAQREVTMSPELREALLKQREAFIQKFGRPPRLTEPVFFDPHADDPQPLDADEVTAALLTACAQAGFDPDEFFSRLGWGEDLDEYRRKIQ